MALEGHEWREAAQGMSEYTHFMEAAYQKLLHHCTNPTGADADEAELAPLYQVLEVKFTWFERHRKTCRQLEAEITKRVKLETGAAPKALPKAKAKAKGKGKAGR